MVDDEKERLAQALRDGDMETFTAAIRKANQPAEPLDAPWSDPVTGDEVERGDVALP